MDFTLYWFMFPVSVLVATTAMLSGIGGAALFTPLFVVVFPLLGPEYPLASTVAAVGTALLTETFGFTSGLLGYLRRRLIDFRTAAAFMLLATPVAVTGALIAHRVSDQVLILAYAGLMVILAGVMIVFQPTAMALAPIPEAAPPEDRLSRRIVSRDGQVHTYRAPRLGVLGAGSTGLGAFLTGMLSVGIGEVVMPQLAKRGVPVAVAAATSVLVVIVVVASASFTQVARLVAEGGLEAVPWHLVCYTVPGVVLGGQLGPHLQGRFPQHHMERAIGVLFLLIALAMAQVGLHSGPTSG